VFEKKQLIPALQQLLATSHGMRRANIALGCYYQADIGMYAKS
jgi:hypothetical protein